MDADTTRTQGTPSPDDSSHKETQAATISPALLDNMASRTVARLGDNLNALYERLDDTLFDLADRAYNNNEQSLYFDSMREIRLHRQGAEQVFRQSIDNAFQRLKNHDPTQFSQKDLEAETLALVDNDEMEADVAINTMVHRARCDLPAPLLQLNTRLNSILPKQCATEDSNPLDPKQIVKAFIQATQNIELDIKIRLILYKEFERCVLQKLDEVILDANQIMIDAGILPDIRATLSRSNVNQLNEKPATKDNQTEEPTSTDQEIRQETLHEAAQFSTLQSLLTATQSLQAESVYIQTDPNQPALTQNALFNWLSNIQSKQMDQVVDGETPAPFAVRQEIFEQVKQAGTDDPNNRLQTVDDNVINIVDLIFEFILDQDIPSPMAALIGRLQIPIIKVAIRDQAFFDSHQHPARRLLNEIAHASIGWDDNSHYRNDPLYRKVEHVVRTIIQTTDPTLELFRKLEEDFHQYVDKESQRSNKLAERTAAAEEGRAKTDAAKKMIKQLIHDRLHGKELPPMVIDFLNGPWQKLLLQIKLRSDSSSDEWREAIQTADDLIWSVQMHTDTKGRQRWMTLIPKLLDRLRASLKQIEHSPAETENTMNALWEIHGKMLTHKGNDNPIKTVKVDLTHTRSAAPVSPLARRKIDPDSIRELRQLVGALDVGKWFEFIQLNGKKLRCKLIRKIRANDSFVFANRYGAKTSAVTRDQLALYIYDKKAKQLDSGPLIDRALQAIMMRLKNSLP